MAKHRKSSKPSYRRLRKVHPTWSKKRLAAANKHQRAPMNIPKRRSPSFLKRSESAKKGWVTRRARYGKSGRKPKKPPVIEGMVRNVWGTACSDKNKPFSFTFYVFSQDDLDSSDATKCENKFTSLIDRWLRLQYPARDYTFSRGEADSWFSEMVRREQNVSVNYDAGDFKKWIFEINGSEDDRGDLNDIL